MTRTYGIASRSRVHSDMHLAIQKSWLCDSCTGTEQEGSMRGFEGGLSEGRPRVGRGTLQCQERGAGGALRQQGATGHFWLVAPQELGLREMHNSVMSREEEKPILTEHPGVPTGGTPPVHGARSCPCWGQNPFAKLHCLVSPLKLSVNGFRT